MNKSLCKKYIRKAFKNMKDFNKSINLENLEIEMKRVSQEDFSEYIAYAKLAFKNIQESANEITENIVVEELDEIMKLYPLVKVIEEAYKLKDK